MLYTVKEAIEKLEQWYKDDLTQPIAFFVDDKESIYGRFIADDSELNTLYPTLDDVPKELFEKVLGEMFEYDSFWDTVNEVQRHELSDFLAEQDREAEQLIDEQQLWDTEMEIKNNDNT